jgi:hypothetical protein
MKPKYSLLNDRRIGTMSSDGRICTILIRAVSTDLDSDAGGRKRWWARAAVVAGNENAI